MHRQEKDLCFLLFLSLCTVLAWRSMRGTANQVSPNIHQAMTLFDLVFWHFVSLGPQVLPVAGNGILVVSGVVGQGGCRP